MKMFLTRIDFGSKVIITGDKTQKDLPGGAVSGLDVAMRVLGKIDDIGFCNLTSNDVVRHPLVQKIVQAYDDYEKESGQTAGEGKNAQIKKSSDITDNGNDKTITMPGRKILSGRKAEYTMTINIEYETDKPLDVDYEKVANDIIPAALDYEKCPYEAEVNLILTDNDAIQEINRDYRQIDRPTDVLSFPMIDFEKESDFSHVEGSSRGLFQSGDRRTDSGRYHCFCGEGH